VPAAQLDRLVVMSELWNHYAAAVLQARLPHVTIPAQRRTRLSGASHMNFTALVLHGLRALSVYSELIGVRLLVLTMVVAVVLVGAAFAAFVLGTSPASAVPGWALVLSGLVALLLFQTLAAVVAFVFLVLHGRSQPLFIPLRDHAYFVRSLRSVFDASMRPASSSVRSHVPR